MVSGHNILMVYSKCERCGVFKFIHGNVLVFPESYVIAAARICQSVGIQRYLPHPLLCVP